MAYQRPSKAANKIQILFGAALTIGFTGMIFVPSQMPEELKIPSLVIGLLSAAFTIFNIIEIRTKP